MSTLHETADFATRVTNLQQTILLAMQGEPTGVVLAATLAHIVTVEASTTDLSEHEHQEWKRLSTIATRMLKNGGITIAGWGPVGRISNI